MLLVDVIATSFGSRGPVARATIIRASDGRRAIGAVVTIPYLVPPCPDRREPGRGEKLVVYLRDGKALGWATPT